MFIDASGLVVNDGSNAYLDGRTSWEGPVGSRMEEIRYEPGLRRPYLYPMNGRMVPHVTINMRTSKGILPQNVPLEWLAQRHSIYSPVANASLLTKDAWIEMDKVVVRATRRRLRAWSDLVSRNPKGGFDAMARYTIEYNQVDDVGFAFVDMDTLAEGHRTRPSIGIGSTPLPITHSDFWFSEREMAVSRRTAVPLDTTMIEMSARRCAETVEQTLIGTVTGLEFGTRSTGPFPHTGNSKVYGYTNFPYRVTKTDLTTPLGSNPQDVMTDVLEMVETMQSNGYFGPYMLYHSTGYSRFLSDDYFRSGSTSAVRSVRQRVMEIEGIEDIRRLDYLTSGYQLILIQMTPDVAEAIDGMQFTTVMWEVKGGGEYHYKIMGIQVPQLKAQKSGITGIIHGTTS